jgi:hypothetical protein
MSTYYTLDEKFRNLGFILEVYRMALLATETMFKFQTKQLIGVIINKVIIK